MKTLRIIVCLLAAGYLIGVGANETPKTLKCSAYLIDEVAQHTKTWWALEQDPEILVDGEKIFKYLSDVQVALNDDFAQLPNTERWETFFNQVFNVLGEQIVDVFSVYKGPNFPDPPVLNLMLAFKNYIFLHPSEVLPLRVIKYAWLSQGVRWALAHARQLEQHSPAEQSYLAYLLDQILPNFTLQHRDYDPLLAPAQEAAIIFAANPVAMQAGLPQVILRKVEFSDLLSLTKNFYLITATWQTFVAQHYQDFSQLHSYSVDFANLYYGLRNNLMELDYGSDSMEQAWRKFWQRYMLIDLTRAEPMPEINKYMLYTIWHGRYDLQDSGVMGVGDIIQQSLMEILAAQTRALHQDAALPETFQAWVKDLSFVFYGPKPMADDLVSPVFYREAELSTLQGWMVAGQDFLRRHEITDALPNFLALVAPELRFTAAAHLMQQYRFWAAGEIYDMDGQITTVQRPQVVARAAKTLAEVNTLLGPKNTKVFLEKYLAEQWHNFSDPFSGEENRWISRECLAGMLQVIFAQKADDLKNVALNTLIAFMNKANQHEYNILGLGEFAYPGEEHFSFVHLVKENFPAPIISSYFSARDLATFVDNLTREMQRMPQNFTNDDILAAQAALQDLVNPALYGEDHLSED